MNVPQAAAAPGPGNDLNPDNDPEIARLLEFEPVERRFKREDGWSPALQRAFIAELAKHGSPGKACDALGKRRSGIDKLYKVAGAESFRAAWNRAVEIAEERAAAKIRADHSAVAGQVPPFRDHRGKPDPRTGEGDEEAGATKPRLPLPVICDRCAAEGLAGDEAFATIPDILAFDPVPRQPHDRHWDEAMQRAFIAAMAASGSPARAARSVGRHVFGAQKLRKARGGKGFADAWDAALEIARDRELARMSGTLSELSQEPEGSDEFDRDEDIASRVDEARKRINQRLFNARRLYLAEICGDEAKRAAWEVLCGPVDWEKAVRFERQDNEPAIPKVREPDMLLPVENDWLGEVTGGEDKTAELAEALEEYQRTGKLPGGEE